MSTSDAAPVCCLLRQPIPGITIRMKSTFRLLKDAGVRKILEQVDPTCSCNIVALKEDINGLVTLLAKPRPSPSQAIRAIDEVLRAAEGLRNVLQRHERSDLLLPNTPLIEFLLPSDLPVTARSPEHPLLQNPGAPTFGDQLAQLIDYYAELKAEWKAVRKARRGRRKTDTSRDMFVLGLRVIFQTPFQ